MTSPTERPNWNTTSDSDPLLRPKMRRTPAYNSSSTSAIRDNWDQPTGDSRSVRTRKWTEKARQGTQVNRNTEDHTLYTCRTVPPDHVRRVLCNLPDMSEHEQCCGRRHLPYQKNTMGPATCIWASTVLWVPTNCLVPDGVGHKTRKHTHSLSLSLS